MKKNIVIALILSVLMLMSFDVSAAVRAWEQVRQERLHEGRSVARVTDIEVRTLNGAILVSSNRQVQVKVFTILGQLISQDTLPAGVSILNLGMHGLFIVKIGDMTCKVAL